MKMLLSGGDVFGESGELLPGHGVLVEDGKVSAVAPSAEFGGYQGERFDTAGGTVLPGLMDCHVHLVMGGEGNPRAAMDHLSPGQITLNTLHRAQQTLRGGITSLRDCGGKDYLELAVRDAIAAGTFSGPNIRAVGRMVCMTGGHGSYLGRIADGKEEVIKAVREQIHAGCDQIKIMATGGVMTPGVNPEDAHYSAEEIGAGIAEGKRFHKRSASHAQGAEGILNAVRGGIDSIEHGIFLDEEGLGEMISRGTFLVATLSAVRNIIANKDNGVPAFAVEKSERVVDRHREAIRMFYKAGGKLAMGTDAGTPYNLHGENSMELEYLVEIGVRPVDALISATSNAAELLDYPERGRVAKGGAADLLVVQGNPLKDITAVSRQENHRAVFKDGVRIV